MKEFLRYVLWFFVFWILLFAIQRTVFLVYNHDELSAISFTEILKSYFFGLRIDLSATAYLAAIPFLLMSVALFVRRNILPRLANGFTVLFILIVLLIGILDTGIYSMWGSKLNSKAFSYALFPGESIKSMRAVPIWLFVLIFCVEAGTLIFVYLKFLKAKVPEKSKTIWKSVSAILVLALLPVLLRGGLQKYPISKNNVYYCRHMVLNYAVLNGPWNSLDVLLRAKKHTNPYRYYDTKKAFSIVTDMHRSACDSVVQILTTDRPNIVFILMESMSAENMQVLGGKEPVMPGMDSLSQESLMFSRFYSTGFRTEQGLISFLSAFPAQPTVTIIREFGKFEKLPSLGRVLSKNGYTCNYYYSGDINFANTSAYLNASSFSKLLDRDARPWNKCTEWGSLDEELFQCHLAEAGKDKQPFFSIIMTSTNHEPFDAPVTTKFSGEGEAAHYKNTSSYSDSCLFAYIKKAKKETWWDNTLFIITSDHAHYFPTNRSKTDPERYHIPLLLLGGALKPEYRGKTIDHIGSQLDMAATLLAQLKVNATSFVWSKNMLDPYKPAFAFYAFDNGFGIITPEQTLVYDHDLTQVVYSEKNIDATHNEKILEAGKAYLQVMYEEYLNLNR